MKENKTATTRFVIAAITCMLYTAAYLLMVNVCEFPLAGIFFILPCLIDSMQSLTVRESMMDKKLRILNICTLCLSFFAILFCIMAVLNIHIDNLAIIILLGMYQVRLLIDAMLSYQEMIGERTKETKQEEEKCEEEKVVELDEEEIFGR